MIEYRSKKKGLGIRRPSGNGDLKFSNHRLIVKDDDVEAIEMLDARGDVEVVDRIVDDAPVADDVAPLLELTKNELMEKAAELGIEGDVRMRKADLARLIADAIVGKPGGGGE